MVLSRCRKTKSIQQTLKDVVSRRDTVVEQTSYFKTAGTLPACTSNKFELQAVLSLKRKGAFFIALKCSKKGSKVLTSELQRFKSIKQAPHLKKRGG